MRPCIPNNAFCSHRPARQVLTGDARLMGSAKQAGTGIREPSVTTAHCCQRNSTRVRCGSSVSHFMNDAEFLSPPPSFPVFPLYLFLPLCHVRLDTLQRTCLFSFLPTFFFPLKNEFCLTYVDACAVQFGTGNSNDFVGTRLPHIFLSRLFFFSFSYFLNVGVTSFHIKVEHDVTAIPAFCVLRLRPITSRPGLRGVSKRLPSHLFFFFHFGLVVFKA